MPRDAAPLEPPDPRDALLDALPDSLDPRDPESLSPLLGSLSLAPLPRPSSPSLQAARDRALQAEFHAALRDRLRRQRHPELPDPLDEPLPAELRSQRSSLARALQARSRPLTPPPSTPQLP